MNQILCDKDVKYIEKILKDMSTRAEKIRAIETYYKELLEIAKTHVKENNTTRDIYIESNEECMNMAKKEAEEYEKCIEWLSKLKELDELNKSGRLIELPCPIGTKIYKIVDFGKQYKQEYGTSYSCIQSEFLLHDISAWSLGYICMTEDEARKRIQELDSIEK